jgi:aldehyde:ferredoxin oxidoreductase
MRRAGFDGIYVKGISEKPVYLFVDNGRAEIRDASKLWGKNTPKPRG